MNTNPAPRDYSRLDGAPELGITTYLRDASGLSAFPQVTNDGDWLTREHARWTGGFVGMLWLAGVLRTHPATFSTARSWALRLNARVADRSTHDMGSLFEPSCVRGHNIGPDEQLRSMFPHGIRLTRRNTLPWPLLTPT